MPDTKPINKDQRQSAPALSAVEEANKDQRPSARALGGVKGAKTESKISANQRQSAAKKRGGRRPGAGAPRGNLNALKHGAYSRQFAQLGATIAASPAATRSLLRLLARFQDRNRRADELAGYILAQVLERGIKRGRDRLILLPPIHDADSISQNTETHEEKTLFTPRDDQSPGAKNEGQSKIR